MPRYVIEMDEPSTCNECVCFVCAKDYAECQLTQVDVPETDQLTYDIPDWCPLVKVDGNLAANPHDRL